MRKFRTKVTNKSTLKKQLQLTAEAATVTTPNVNLQEKRSPPKSIIKRLWPWLGPESSNLPKITGPPKVGSLPSTSPPQSKTEAQVL